MNPTEDVLEKCLAALEGGAAALTLSSGTAAIYFTVTNIAETGSEFVSADNVYGGTYVQFNTILPQSNNIRVKWTHLNDFAAVEAAINEKTRFVYVEAIGNPTLGVADIEEYAKVAHKHGIPLVVDATFATPILEHPIQWGAAAGVKVEARDCFEESALRLFVTFLDGITFSVGTARVGVKMAGKRGIWELA